MEPSTENPYRSPLGELALAASERIGWGSASASFTVGDAVVHTVTVVASLWTGSEVYLVDGREVLRRRSFALWGSRRFSIDAPERHEVEIRFQLFPFFAQARVDGQLIVRDLFPKLRNVTVAALLTLGVSLFLACYFFG